MTHLTFFKERLKSVRWPMLVTLLLLAVIASQLATLFWQLMEPGRALPQPLVATQVVSGDGDAARLLQSNLYTIQKANLFGRAAVIKKATAVPAVRRSEAAPDTRLKLVLTGIFSNADEALGLAIIRSDRGDEKSYGVGDELPGGATLKEVHTSWIVLLHKGRYETLKFVEDKNVTRLLKESVNQAAATSYDYRQDAQMSELLAEVREEILSDPLSMIDMIQFRPASNNGKQVGFEITLTDSADMLRAVGLQNDDIITAINGIELTNNQAGNKAMRLLRKAQQLQLDITRQGEPMNFHFQLGG